MALQGADKLRRKLLAMNRRVRADLEKAVLSAAQDIAKTARALAPHDSGALRSSIGATLGDPPATTSSISLGSVLRASGDSNVTLAARRGVYASVYAGDDEAYYARFVEFGTKASPARAQRRNMKYRRTYVLTKAYSAHHETPAQPFFYPAYRANKKKAKAKIARAINRTIKTAAKS